VTHAPTAPGKSCQRLVNKRGGIVDGQYRILSTTED